MTTVRSRPPGQRVALVAAALAVCAHGACRAGAAPPPASTSPAPASSSPASRPPASRAAVLAEERRVAIGEASAVIALPGGRFLVADDERGVLVVDAAPGAAARVLAPLSDLEGLCACSPPSPAGPTGAVLYLALEERSGALHSFSLDGKGGPPLARGALARPGDKPNKGWEGLALMPASVSYDGKEHFIAVHEGAPAAVVAFSPSTLAEEGRALLTGALALLLPDLSDVAVDPQTGELLLLTDEGNRIVRARFDGRALVAAEILELPFVAGEKPEGISFDDKGQLWLVTDKSGRLIRIAAPIPSPPSSPPSSSSP